MGDILLVLWFFLPAGLANMAPIPLGALLGRRWGAPIDGGRSFRGKRLLGANKTWRGLIAGIIVATLTVWLQQWLVRHTYWAASISRPIRYAELPTLLLGPLFAIGALGGDAVKSFIKRQRNFPPGKPWHPYDEMDTIIGSCIVTAPIVTFSTGQYVIALVLLPALQFLTSFIGYALGIKERPF